MKKSDNVISLPTRIAALAMGVLLLGGFGYFLFGGNDKALPVLGDPGHIAGAFSFINQDGQPVTEQTVEHKVTVVEYFFTSCPSICPVMSKNLQTVYNQFMSEPGFMILSHTVDPDRDSVSRLKKYADRWNAKTPGWEFLTGSKDRLYQAAMKDYLLAVEDSSNTNFIHTQYVALLDKKRRIRGFYDMTDEGSLPKLDAAIRQLLKAGD